MLRRPNLNQECSAVAAILLAAGKSRRWGEENKLLAPIDGKPMIRRTAEAVLGSKLRPVIVVTGHDSDGVEAALTGLDVQFKYAPDFADGMAASLKAGIASVPDHCDAVAVCLGDMPFIGAQTLDRLAASYDRANDYADWIALIPTHKGVRGNPVIIGRALFPEIERLTGDQGARKLLSENADRVGEANFDDPGILRDIDRPEMLKP
jgi:molybdenum cofactor cytidylyltransferase